MSFRSFMSAVMAFGILTAAADTRTNAGSAYLLSQSIDVSKDFADFTNTYFFADSLAGFDTSTGRGTISWKRQQLMPRQAFNANTYLHQPLKSLDFPDTAYPQNPDLGFSIEPVNGRTLRLRIHTSPVAPADPDSLSPMLAGPVANDASAWKVTRKGADVLYTSPYGSLRIQADPWRIVILDSEGRELSRTRTWSDNDSTQIKVPPFSFIKRGADNSRSINPVFSLTPGERIFGFGEGPGPLDKAGQKLNLFVTDPQGPESPDMYKPIPFFFSNLGYGMFIHTSAPLTADVGQSYIGANKLFMADEDLDLFIMWGTPKEILSEYTALSGRPEMPPLWSFGTWMSRISYFTEDEGRDVAAKLRSNRIPADVIHFDTGWFDTDWQCDYEFSPERFRNPRKMISDLAKDGFHICLWQLPYFVPGNKYFPELVSKGLAVKNGRGTLPYEDAVLDFTNPYYNRSLDIDCIESVCFRTEQRKAVVMFSGQNQIVHPALFRQSHPVLRPEAYRLKGFRQLFIFRNGNPLMGLDPFAVAAAAPSVPFSSCQGVQSPVNHHSVPCFPKPFFRIHPITFLSPSKIHF